MLAKLRKPLIALVIIVLILGIVGAALWPRAVQASFPQVDGEIRLPGLDGAVDVYRDSNGVPHIYASTEHDLFVAQGYVHAQDRFWQMDFQRHVGAGRLSELLGSSTMDTDIFLRTMGWERVSREELELQDPATRAILEAYAEGVNAYLADHSGTQLSLEYLFINLLNRGYEPAPWTPLNTLTWAKAMAWDLRGNMDDEIDRAWALKTLTAEQIAELNPEYPQDHPYIVNDLTPFTSGHSPAQDSAGAPGSNDALAALQTVQRRADALSALLGAPAESGLGSNSWVVSGALTDTGKPLLADDPHLDLAIPSIWYQVGLHCTPRTSECPLDLAGFSFVGAPGIVIGHNNRIAWGFTNVGPDVMDLFIEKINPDNPNQYEFEGEWVDMELVTETVNVGGGDPVEVIVRITRHGPIISDSYGDLENFAEESGLELPENYAIALRWTALEPNFVFRALYGFMRAQNWVEFRASAFFFEVPAQNLLYADVDGNIAYQMPGKIPLRAGDSDGRYPVPGWTGEGEWLGYVPFEELPFAFNPPEGYIVTANNAVVSSDYPYQIADTWDYGYRAQRIVDMIQNAPGPIDVAYMAQMQGDNKNLSAETLVPILMQIPLGDEHLAEVRSLLDGWDYQQGMDSSPAALYEAFWNHLLAATFHDEVPEDLWPSGGSRWFSVVRNLSEDPESAWWDDVNTPDSETRDQIFAAAFAAAVADLEDRLGNDPSQWSWGQLHTLTLEHAVMSSFPLINAAFERGPFPVSGGKGLVNNISWDADADSYVGSGSAPSFRMVVDLSNFQNSLSVHPTGQSGHAGHPHYDDLIELWQLIQHYPMHWDLSAIQADLESHLRLVP